MDDRLPTAAPAEPEQRAVPRTQRLFGLEGPRGVGFLAVLLVHVAVHFSPGVLAATRIDFLGQALTFFFALSGFLLYLPYVKALSQHREMPKVTTYLRHRLFRIFPAYLAIFLIANFIMRAVYVENPFTVGWSSSGEATGVITRPMELIANLTLTQSLFPGTLQTGINPSWSLTTEWGFYLALPIVGATLFLFAKRIGRPLVACLWPVLALVLVGVVSNTLVGFQQVKYYGDNILEGYWGENWTAVISRSFLSLADTFAFGMLAAVIYVALMRGAFKRMSVFQLQTFFASLMTVALLISFALFIFNPRYLHTAFAFASSAFILLIIAPIARNQHSAIASITDWRPIRYLGMISLSGYLWHYPVLLVIERFGLPIPQNAGGLIIAFILVGAATIALASVTYRFIESPAMNFRG